MIRRRGKRRLNVIKIFLTASSIVPGNNLSGFNGSTARGRSQEQPWCRSKAHRTWRGCVSSHCRGVWGWPRAHRAENSPAPTEFPAFPVPAAHGCEAAHGAPAPLQHSWGSRGIFHMVQAQGSCKNHRLWLSSQAALAREAAVKSRGAGRGHAGCSGSPGVLEVALGIPGFSFPASGCHEQEVRGAVSKEAPGTASRTQNK